MTALPQAPKLPIYAYEEALVSAIKDHRVVVVEGPPGCGKTTQLPRILRRHRLVPKRLGITQPRRIAATSVAARIAFEEGQTLGDEVGYSIRFDDCTSPFTAIKVMTDGILLQEARGDDRLSDYDIIMVDEAHERSLNIDLTLGLLLRALKLRQDLKVVVSSATLNPEIFVDFFQALGGEVPILSIPTRTHPISIRYAPPEDKSFESLIEATADQIVHLHHTLPHGHILVFLPGEGSINKVAQELSDRHLSGCVILPLFGRLPTHEQQRVFDDVGSARKVVLATNIAETSITIDGVVAVIDSGLGKVPWFNGHTGVTTLREEPVCRASLNQRAGRAGRTAPGVVVRLFDEDSFATRSEFGAEEILRIDLSEAVLRLIDLGVKEVEAFAFPTPPKAGRLRGAVKQLEALGAIDAPRRLTDIGRRMVPFPLSPAMSRMVVEAAEYFPEAISDVLLAGAFLSVRSPFTFPQGFEQEARQAQKRLRDPLGDTITFIRAYHRFTRAADQAQFCRENYLEPDTMAFVGRAHEQLCDIAAQQGLFVPNGPADVRDVVRCVAAGFADKVMIREPGAWGFVTLAGLYVNLHPSSALFHSTCEFAVATELVDSGRLYAFGVSALTQTMVAQVNPQAAEQWGLRPERGKKRRARERNVKPPGGAGRPWQKKAPADGPERPRTHGRKKRRAGRKPR